MAAEMRAETNEVIAKEIMLAVINNAFKPREQTAKLTGDEYGLLYKAILKHVREAYEKKYD